jgi:uncharacterized protein YfeS
MEIEDDDHDPWNEPAHRHPRAADLMRDEMFWDCANELAPFCSDEGADAYVEYRRWRRENPNLNLVECIAWILNGNIAQYNRSLLDEEAIEECDESADLMGYSDAFTLDATIIATVLGQLVDEGCIDAEAKPFAKLAISRQSHPVLLERFEDEEAATERRTILARVSAMIDLA